MLDKIFLRGDCQFPSWQGVGYSLETAVHAVNITDNDEALLPALFEILFTKSTYSVALYPIELWITCYCRSLNMSEMRLRRVLMDWRALSWMIQFKKDGRKLGAQNRCRAGMVKRAVSARLLN